MGCDSPVGWNDVQDTYRREWKERGYRINSLGDPFTCIRCGSEVRRVMVDIHDEFHFALLALLVA